MSENVVALVVILGGISFFILILTLMNFNTRINELKNTLYDRSERLNRMNGRVESLYEYLTTAIKNADVELLKQPLRDALSDPWHSPMKIKQEVLLRVLEEKSKNDDLTNRE